jgi:hypothetical protein
MPKNPFSPRLLKKVQVQGGTPGTHPEDGHPSKGWVPGRWVFFSSLLGREGWGPRSGRAQGLESKPLPRGLTGHAGLLIQGDEMLGQFGLE